MGNAVFLLSVVHRFRLQSAAFPVLLPTAAAREPHSFFIEKNNPVF